MDLPRSSQGTLGLTALIAIRTLFPGWVFHNSVRLDRRLRGVSCGSRGPISSLTIVGLFVFDILGIP